MKTVHTNTKDSDCEECTNLILIPPKHNLKCHMKTVHQNIKTINCEYCNFTATQQNNMLRHNIFDHQVQLTYQIPLECLGKREKRNKGDGHGTIKVEEEEYADDLVCLAGTVDEAKFVVESYNEVFLRFGLTIAKEKTETVSFNCKNVIQKKRVFILN